MKLPWTDVFTTNYDTLLERTEIDERSYQPVVNACELTTAFSPRIIKLHGSLSSQTPFIITEDDFRTYPTKFAPFVNTVQQSLIENALVLVGFSGDDPNFLAWTGWIRDHLGEHHAPIYLIEPLSLEEHQRAYLKQRGVTPIDLSPMFVARDPMDDVYLKSLLWFLECLNGSRPDRPESWPETSRLVVSQSEGLPPLVVPSRSVPESPLFHSKETPLTAEDVANVLKRWQFERERYPRWVVAPDSKRSSIWERTKYWIHSLVRFSEEWSTVDRLLLFREINWRLEIAMVPLFQESIKPFEKVVIEHLPILQQRLHERPKQIDMPIASASLQDVEDCWFELAFALLRESREMCNEGRWDQLKGQIDLVIASASRHQDRFQYEIALRAIWNLDRCETKELLQKWQPASQNLQASMWKAGLLIELDDLGEARSLLRGVLERVRKTLNKQGRSIELLSLEGWCSYLLFAVENLLDWSSTPILVEEFRDRWQELKALDCNPWSLIEYFDEVIKTPPKKFTKTSNTHSFDSGQFTITEHWDGAPVENYLPAFACIRLFEQVGLPMQLPSFTNWSRAVTAASRWVTESFGFGGPSVYIRACRFENIKDGDFLSRTQVALMDRSTAVRLHDWCFGILGKEISELDTVPAGNSTQEKLLRVLPEVLSRLVLRMKPNALDSSFALALKYHTNPSVCQHLTLHEYAAPWFKRLFFAADPELLLKWLPELLRLPLLRSKIHQNVSIAQVSPDPIGFFPTERIRGMSSIPSELATGIKEAADWLFLRIPSETGEARRRGEYRIIALFEARLLSSEQEQKLSDLLWEKQNAFGLPDNPNITPYGYLLLPSPPDKDVSSLVKARILKIPFSCCVRKNDNGSFAIEHPWEVDPFIREVALVSKPLVCGSADPSGLIQWTPSESKALLERVVRWWNAHKMALGRDSFGRFTVRHIESTVKEIPQYLSRAVIPNVSDMTEDEWKSLSVCLDEMRDVGFYPTVSLPYILIHLPEKSDETTLRILEDLRSDSEECVAAAAEAVRHWVQLAERKHVPIYSSELILTLIHRVIFRRQSGLLMCLDVLTLLLKESPGSFSRSDIELMISSLLAWHGVLEMTNQSELPSEFDLADKPIFRTYVARLVSALSVWMKSNRPGEPEPPSIELWRNTCANDPLPEVRRSFSV
ncbi:MAG: SIR2 family protein [Opitutales bacterium]|nr:SIR2 family protein [Opitutales bacterium]